MKTSTQRIILIGAIVFSSTVGAFMMMRTCRGEPAAGRTGLARGIWVSVFTEQRVHYSPQAVNELIDFCRDTGIGEIYFQLFQSGRAYYDSAFCEREQYERMIREAGADPLELLLKKAHQNNIKVYAWVNALSVGNNHSAHILKQYGKAILTVDQHRKNSLRAPESEKDTCNIRENQLFLEPGDPRVQEYLVNVVGEIVNRYPQLDGIHLDYIRYPASVPYTPGSRFNSAGLTYGYAIKNVQRFQEKTGLDPMKPLKNNQEYLAWDDWKRQQVTALLERIVKAVKKGAVRMRVSCAVLAVANRAYESAFQEWPLWIERGIVDYVVLMNYTIDNALFAQNVKSALAFQDRGKAFIGIGAFLLKGEPQALQQQYAIARQEGCSGVVFFSYDKETVGLLRGLQ